MKTELFKRKKILLCLAFLSLSLSLFASESYKGGYKIYPIPQKQVELGYNILIGKSINIVTESGIDEATLARAKQILSEHSFAISFSGKHAKGSTNLYLGVNGSGEIADREIAKLNLDTDLFDLDKFDRHILSITKAKDGGAKVIILGESTDAVFCGLASLEQILESNDKTLEGVNIFDYADVRSRGIIEGYYGVPYSAAVTKDLFRFMAKYKMNTYMYGAKSDPYHSRYWAEPYPTSITADQERIGYLSQEMMSDIAQVASECKIKFIWAIHPGKAFADPANKEIIAQIMGKFESMYSLGVREFGVFVDDVGVPSDDAILELCASNLGQLQDKIDEKWNGKGGKAEDRVGALHYVPQLYAYSWVSEDKGEKFFKSLSDVASKVNIYITGKNVWSVPNNEDLSKVSSWLGGKLNWWWNYACNDQDMTKVFIMDTYSNFRDESHILNLSTIEHNLQGTNTVIINPMQQGELSKIPLFSIADYTWNNSSFNNYLSWENSFKAAVGEEWCKDLRTAAPYLRYYDNDALEYLVLRYKQSVERGRPLPDALTEELKKVCLACENLKRMKDSQSESDRLFYNDLRPWLLKLNAMASEALALMEGKNPPEIDYDNNSDFQFEILGGMGEYISLAIRRAEPSAVVLPEFIKWLRERK